MRVVLNGLSASGSKTGVGHYTAQLLRCLEAQRDGDELDVFPQGWVRRAYAMRRVGCGPGCDPRGRPRPAALRPRQSQRPLPPRVVVF